MASKVAFAKPDIEKPDMVLEEHYRIPGGTVTVVFTRITPGRLPSAYISAEPAEASAALTRLRDQVLLLNDLRRWGNERLLRTLIDADRQLHPVFLVAQTVLEAR